MEIDKELEEVSARQAEVVKRLNAIKEEEQTLIQEALRLDGEIRLLQRLALPRAEGLGKDGQKEDKGSE